MAKNKHEYEFLPAVLEVQDTPPSPLGRIIIWSLIIFFIIAVVWAMVGKVDIVSIAQGKIIPSGRVKVIQPLEMGVVRNIVVTEGQWVKQGDTLIELDPTLSEADGQRLKDELLAAQLDRVRLKSLVELLDKGQYSIRDKKRIKKALSAIDTSNKEAITLQISRLGSEWNGQRARLQAFEQAIKSRTAELAAIRESVIKLEGTLPLITKRAEAVKGMAKKKLASEHTWMELEQERVEQQQDLAALRNQVDQVKASIEEAKQQKAASHAEFQGALFNQLTETDRLVDSIEQELVKTTQRTTLQRLVAPIDGIVTQLSVHTVGGVVRPAQELMKIVPQEDNLEVEAWIQNKDIGFVQEEQKAEIKVDAFPFTKYGTLDATIVDISNDAVSDENKGLVYASRVILERTKILVGDKLVNLTPGMSVTVEVKTGKRRLIEYFLSPIMQHTDESIRER